MLTTMLAAGGAAWARAGAYAGAVWPAAQPGDPDPTSGRPDEWGKAAPAGLLIWLFLGASLFLLIRSMNRHIRRVNRAAAENTFGDGGAANDATEGGAAAAADDAPDGDTGDAGAASAGETVAAAAAGAADVVEAQGDVK